MEKIDIENLKKLSLEDILNIRKDLEEYLNVIDQYVITSKTDLQGNITFVSQAFAKISGYTEEELLGKPHNIVRDPEVSKEVYEDLWNTIKSGNTWSGELKNKRKDGGYYWVSSKITPTYDYNGKHIGYTSIRHDITDKKKIEELSLADELTGLYNRRYFNQIIDKEINRAKRDQKVFSFLLLDIDYFKQYNDHYGHQQGDIALEKTGDFLKHYFKRATDIAFRLGGEEFCVIYTTDTQQQSKELANRLCRDFKDLNIEHSYSKVSKDLTVSVGLVSCDFPSNLIKSATSKNLYIESDKALYRAKESGRDRVSSIELK